VFDEIEEEYSGGITYVSNNPSSTQGTDKYSSRYYSCEGGKCRSESLDEVIIDSYEITIKYFKDDNGEYPGKK